jgi:hypothetical protein
VISAFYVYAITHRDAALPAPESSGGANLTKITHRHLAAVVRPISYDAPAVSVEAVMQHEAVVEAVRRQAPALPVRFGTVFRNETSAVAAIDERYQVLADDLERLGTSVEFSLTAIWALPAHPEVTQESWSTASAFAQRSEGARYLLERAALVRREDDLSRQARRVAHELDERLSWLTVERKVSLLPTPRVAIRTAYLLDPANVRAFRDAFELIRGNRRDLRVLLTGPWPPYSFVQQTEMNRVASSDTASFAQLVTEGRLG